jgi:hypothetical protein
VVSRCLLAFAGGLRSLAVSGRLETPDCASLHLQRFSEASDRRSGAIRDAPVGTKESKRSPSASTVSGRNTRVRCESRKRDVY